MYRIIVFGNASNSEILNKIVDSDLLNTDVLTWLRTQNIPIASSCFGEGICKKCLINGDLLACKTILKNIMANEDFSEIRIYVSYL